MLWSRGYSWFSEDWRIIRFCEKILLYLIRAKSYTAYGTKLAVRTVLSRVLFRGLLEKTSPCMQSRMGFIWLHFGRRRTLFFFFFHLGKISVIALWSTQDAHFPCAPPTFMECSVLFIEFHSGSCFFRETQGHCSAIVCSVSASYVGRN